MRKLFKVGEIIRCVVTGYKDFGIFVTVNNNFNGLIHISEISDGFVKNVEDYADIGDRIYAKIIAIDVINMQLKLSIKDIDYKSSETHVKGDKNGFTPLKNHLNIWINDKLKEINKFNEK